MLNTKTKKRRKNLRGRFCCFMILSIIIGCFTFLPKDTEVEESEQTAIEAITVDEVPEEIEKEQTLCENVSTTVYESITTESEETENYEDYLKPVIHISVGERKLLCKLVHAESSRTDTDEMVGIAATVINRVKSEDFPDSVEEVIFQENQFATARDGEIYWYPVKYEKAVLEYRDVKEEVKDAVDAALYGEDPTRSEIEDGAVFFYSDRYISIEERALREGKIGENVKYGDTIFYREYK